MQNLKIRNIQVGKIRYYFENLLFEHLFFLKEIHITNLSYLII